MKNKALFILAIAAILLTIATAYAIFMFNTQKTSNTDIDIIIEDPNTLGEITAELVLTFDGEVQDQPGFSFDAEDEMSKYVYTLYLSHLPSVDINHPDADYSKVQISIQIEDETLAEYLLFDVQYVETKQVESQFVSEYTITYAYQDDMAPKDIETYETLKSIIGSLKLFEENILTITITFDESIYGLED
ncbi:hypothetical protein JV173_03680 [Acholeplasma equirhinis]|uniref:hypothetical protein n=1 Tax=Acholeplasma equirhinis TaxID=555393 RepID=UPI00197AC253|nr:hypothetical protein [Acholeplasma equirhinis]MBN3490610.1 hypothetical protein [Acholeplasma equirhinis]